MAHNQEFQKEIQTYMDAGFPILYVQTIENGSVRDTLQRTAANSGRSLLSWSLHGGLRDYSDGSVARLELERALDLLLGDTKILERKIFIIEDIISRFEKPAIVSRLRALAEMLQKGEEVSECTVAIVAPAATIPAELELYTTLLTSPYPTREEIIRRIVEYADSNRSPRPVEDLLERYAISLRGLTETEIDNILALALVNDNRLDASDLPMIRRQKQQMIQKSGILEIVNAPDSLDDIGGLDKLKKWLRIKASVFENAVPAYAFGVDIPKGVLIAGMPGCGKSLAAKAVAKAFDAPLLRMDMGRLMGKYVGESESNMRRALQLTEACSPCILWIDELEKVFSGVQAGGGGSEVSTRLFGNFLTWMQEKDAPAFVVATANNISCLPPELLRKGRFDEIFYVAFPNLEERRKILEIHIKKRRPADYEQIDVDKIAGQTEGFCGADLEGVVKDAVEAAFGEGREHLSTGEFLAAVQRTSPISETMADSIEKMEEAYESKKFKNASK